MIVKMNNKDEKFYEYMGKFFGSRLVEKQVNDRIYDDDQKDWYLYIENGVVLAFISIQNKIIKNIYGYKEIHLEKLLKYIKMNEKISTSVLTKKYIQIYENCGFKIIESSSYKNFVTVYIEDKKVG